MWSLIQQNKGRLLVSAVLHLALFVALLTNISVFSRPLSAPAVQFRSEPVDVIDAVAVELEVFERIEREIRTAEQERVASALQAEEARRREEERRVREEQRRREAEERARQEALRAAEEARREAQRVAEEARRTADAERARIEQDRRAAEAERARAEAERVRAEAERKAAEEARRAAEEARRAEEERQARERREREAAEQRRAEEEARRREQQARELEEQRRREQMEQERQRLAAAQAARDEADRRARIDSARNAYVAEVEAIVKRRWRQPEVQRSGEEAIVLVRINAETGRILSFAVQSCSGSTAFCDSVRQTMERLQSLPRPPDAQSVQGGIRIRFAPDAG